MGGAAPGPQGGETVSGRSEACTAVRTGGEDDGNRYEFKNVSVVVEVFRFDAKITITQRGDDPLAILVSQKVCADPNHLANDLEVDTYLEEMG